MCRAALALLLIAAPAVADPPRLDLYGDPLPAGAVARLGSTLLQHGTYRAVRFAPDGKTFHAAAAGPAWVQWDAATGKRLKVVHFAVGRFDTPWVSLDGSTALVKTTADAHHVVDVPTGKSRLALPASFKLFHSQVHFRGLVEMTEDPLSANGAFVAGFDTADPKAPVVRLWETHTGRSWDLGPLADPTGPLLFSPDGTRLVAAGRGAVACWSVAAKTVLWSSPLVRPRDNVRFSSDGGRVVIEHELADGGPRAFVVWDAATGKPPAGVKLPPVHHTPVGVSRDGREVLVAYDVPPVKELRWWDTRDGTWRPLPGAASNAVLSPGGKSYLSRDSHQIQLHDAATGDALFPDVRSQRHAEWMTDVAFDPTGTRVYSVGGDGTAREWRAADGELLRTVAFVPTGPCHASHIIPKQNGRECVLQWTKYDGGHTLAVLNVATWRIEQTQDFTGGQELYFGQPHVAPDGSVRRTRETWVPGPNGEGGTWRTELMSWHPSTGRIGGPRQIALPPSFSGAVYSPDGRLVAGDNVVCDAETGKPVLKLANEDGEAREHAPSSFSADGRYVSVQTLRAGLRGGRMPAISYPDSWRGVWVWDTRTGKVVARVPSRGDQQKLTPDGRRLVTADPTGISVWDVATGKRLAHHTPDAASGHREGGLDTMSLAVSPDGRFAATGRQDGDGFVWDLSAAGRK